MSVIKDFKRLILGNVKIRDEGGTAFIDEGRVKPLGVDDEGILLTRISGNNTADVVNVIPGDSDDQVAGRRGQVAHSFNYGYDPDGLNWDRLRALGDNTDAVTPEAQGILKVSARLYGFNGTNFDRIVLSEPDDFVPNLGQKNIGVINRNTRYDSTDDTWNREHTNSEESIISSLSGPYSATQASGTFFNFNFRGCHIVFNVTAVSGTGSVKPVIQAIDPADGAFYDLLVGPAVTTIGKTILKLYPGITASANASASDILPRRWRVEVRHADASDYNYDVSGNMVV